MKFIVAQLLMLALGGALGAAIPNCHLQQLSDCGDPLAEFRKEMGQRFPTNEEQVENFCQKMDDGLKCVEEYQNRCMTPMQLQVMGFLSEGSMDVYQEFCVQDSELRTDYLKNAECLNEASQTDEAKEYYTYVEAALEDLSEKPVEQRLATACCGYQWLTQRTDKMGREKCGQEALDSFNRVVNMAVSNLPDVLCSGFDPDSEMCTQVLPPPGTQPKGTLKESHIAKSFTALYL